MAAALVDQNKLSSLHIEQSQLISLIKNKEGSIKQKVNRWAEVLEELINLADPEIDPMLTVNQISTYIANSCRSYNIAIADDVHHYLPDKYKNPNKQNFLLEDSRTASRNWGGIDPSLLIEELIALPIEVVENLPTEKKQILYHAITKSNGLKNILEADAVKKGYQFQDKTLRGPIKQKVYPPKITSLSNALGYYINRMTEFQEMVREEYAPPPELDMDFADGIMAAAEIWENFNNHKYSLALSEWLERDIYRIHQSKHGAAVKDKVMTTLCKHCSILNRDHYEPGDFVEMEWDWNSPTHWRCPDCGGTDGVPRGLTREQCGDIAIQKCPHCKEPLDWEQGLSPIETKAVDLVNNLPGYYDLLKYYNTLPQVEIYSRKVKLGVDLSSKA